LAYGFSFRRAPKFFRGFFFNGLPRLTYNVSTKIEHSVPDGYTDQLHRPMFSWAIAAVTGL
jgi:hypothetical protein